MESFIPCNFREVESCKKSFLHGTEATVPQSMHPFAFRVWSPGQPSVKNVGPGLSLPQGEARTYIRISGQGMGVCMITMCYVNRIKSKLLNMDAGPLSVWPLPTCPALGHAVLPVLPMPLTRLWPGGLPLHVPLPSPPYFMPLCYFLLLTLPLPVFSSLFSSPGWHLLIFSNPAQVSSALWCLSAWIKRFFIHSTNIYRVLWTRQALFWDLVVAQQAKEPTCL